MGYRALSQIILVIVAVVIIVTYIMPTLNSMKETQSQTEEYRQVLDSAEAFYAELQRLTNKADSFSEAEMRALERFLPEEVDPIVVMRDITIIVANNGMELSELSAAESTQVEISAPDSSADESGSETYEDFSDPAEMGMTEPTSSGQAPAPSESGLFAQQFKVNVSGGYDQFKRLLQDFERNAYPLAVAELTVGGEGDSGGSDTAGAGATSEADSLTFSLTLETYARSDSGADIGGDDTSNN